MPALFCLTFRVVCGLLRVDLRRSYVPCEVFLVNIFKTPPFYTHLEKLKSPQFAGFYLIDLNLILIQSILQTFTRLETWHLSGLDFQWSTGTWVTACTRSTLAHTESAKTNQSHRIPLFEGLFDSLNYGCKCACGSCFRNVRFRCDVFDQFGLVHVSVPIVDLDTSNADFTSLLKFNRFENTPIGVSKYLSHRDRPRSIFVM